MIFNSINLFDLIRKFPIAFLGDILVLLPIIYIFFFKLQKENKTIKYLYGFLVVTAIKNLLTYIFILNIDKPNTLYISNFFLPIQFLFIYLVYQTFISDKKKLQIFIKVIFFTFILLFLIDSYFSNQDFFDWRNHRMNKYSYFLESILIIFGVLYYFYRILIEVNVPNLLKFLNFWICCGLVFFHAGSCFVNIFLYEIFVWKDNLDLGKLEFLPNLLEAVQYIFFTIGLWLYRKDLT